MKNLTLRTLWVAMVAIAAPGAAQNLELPPVSPEIAVEPGHRLVRTLLAIGEQAYTCVQQPNGTLAWGPGSVPTAYLYDPWNYKVGDHGFDTTANTPFWKLDRGGEVMAKRTGGVDAADKASIAWLRLEAISPKGGFAGVRHIQRLYTGGGRPPSHGCDAAAAKARKSIRVGYTATYFFWAK